MHHGDSSATRTQAEHDAQAAQHEGCWLGRIVTWFVLGSSLFALLAPSFDAALAQAGSLPVLRWALGAITLGLLAVITLRVALALARRRAYRSHRRLAGAKDA